MMKRQVDEIVHEDALASATELFIAQEGCPAENFSYIREEMNHFMLQLHRGQTADGCDQQIHHLFLALSHLDRVEKQLRLTSGQDDLIQLERIHEKIRQLKRTLLLYIRLLCEPV